MFTLFASGVLFCTGLTTSYDVNFAVDAQNQVISGSLADPEGEYMTLSVKFQNISQTNNCLISNEIEICFSDDKNKADLKLTLQNQGPQKTETGVLSCKPFYSIFDDRDGEAQPFYLKSGHYNSIKKARTLAEIQGVIPQDHQILLYSQFVSSAQFPNGNGFHNMVQSQLSNSAYEMVYIGRGAYRTGVKISQLTPAFFQSLKNIQYLLGSEYTTQIIDSNPSNFIFQSSRNLPIVSDLVGQVRMQVLETNQVDANLLNQVQSLTGRATQPQRVVILDMQNFNKNLLFTKMVISLYANADQTTDIEALTTTVFHDFPSFGSSYIERTAEEDLRGFAERLHSMSL